VPLVEFGEQVEILPLNVARGIRRRVEVEDARLLGRSTVP